MTTAIAEEKPELETLRLAVRGQASWVAWIDDAARRTHRNRSSLLEAALAAFAKDAGLVEPPRRV